MLDFPVDMEDREEIINMIRSDSPHYRSYLAFDSFTLNDDMIYSIETQHASVNSTEFAPGSIISQTITIEAELTDSELNGSELTGEEFSWKMSIVKNNGDETDAVISMGVFVVDSCKKVNNHYKIQGSDRLSKADQIYSHNANLMFPLAFDQIISDICNQLGIYYSGLEVDGVFRTKSKEPFYTSDEEPFEVYDFNWKIYSIPENTTMREMLGFIAGLQGKFGIVDRFGEFKLKDFETTSENVLTDRIDEPEIADKYDAFRTVRCYIDKEKKKFVEYKTSTSIAGTKRIVEMYNPYMTNMLIKRIWQNIRNRKFWSCKIPLMMCDPRIDVWDVCKLSYNGSNIDIYIAELERTYSGGLSANITTEITNKEA